jgi:hypothetical protein
MIWTFATIIGSDLLQIVQIQKNNISCSVMLKTKPSRSLIDISIETENKQKAT